MSRETEINREMGLWVTVRAFPEDHLMGKSLPEYEQHLPVVLR